MTEKFIDKPRTAPVENVALIACDAPFVAKRAYLPAYRQSPLIVQEDKCSKSPRAPCSPRFTSVDPLNSHWTAFRVTTRVIRRTRMPSRRRALTPRRRFATATRFTRHSAEISRTRRRFHTRHVASNARRFEECKGKPTVVLNEYCLPNVTGSKPPLVVEPCPPNSSSANGTRRVCVTNTTTANYDVKTSVAIARGSFAGVKRGTMYVPPLGSASLYFTVVPIVAGSATPRVVHQRRAIIGEIRPTGRGASGVRATFRCRMSNSLFLATRSLCDFIQNEINLSPPVRPTQ